MDRSQDSVLAKLFIYKATAILVSLVLRQEVEKCFPASLINKNEMKLDYFLAESNYAVESLLFVDHFRSTSSHSKHGMVI